MNRSVKFEFHNMPPVLIIKHNLFVAFVPSSEALQTNAQ